MEHLPLDGAQGPLGLLLAQIGGLQQVEAVADRGERIAQLVAEHGEELVLAAVGLHELLRPEPQLLLGPLAVGDVAVDAGGSDQPSTRVADRREGQRDVEALATPANADGLERLDLDPRRIFSNTAAINGCWSGGTIRSSVRPIASRAE